MDIVVEVQVAGHLFAQVQAAFDFIDKRLNEGVEAATPSLSREILASLHRVAQEMARRHSAPWHWTGAPGHGNPDLFRRSGGGLRSIEQSIHVAGGRMDALMGRISTADLTIHETGGVVRARRAKYLTIPLEAALDGRGLPLRRRARDWENTYVARSRRGNLMIFQKRGRQTVPLYLLKPEVYIPPRLGMAPAFSKELPYFERRAFEAIARTLDNYP